MSVLVAFVVTPLGVGEEVGAVVAEAVRVVRASGLPNHTDAMFTVVEGELGQGLRCGEAGGRGGCLAGASGRYGDQADYRPAVAGALTSKVEDTERFLGTDTAA